MGILEKISEIEKEIARTQKNKGETHFRLELDSVASTNFIIFFFNSTFYRLQQGRSPIQIYKQPPK